VPFVLLISNDNDVDKGSDLLLSAEDGTMRHSSLSESERTRNWKELYIAALFESDKTIIPEKISEAQRAIRLRRRQLLEEPGCDAQERQALDNALFSLQALRPCLAIPRNAAA
jgi:hypothetical protein